MKLSNQRIEFLKRNAEYRKRMKVCKEFTKSFFGMVNVITNQYRAIHKIETI